MRNNKILILFFLLVIFLVIIIFVYFNFNKKEDIFSFKHIDFDGGVGWTRIMKNGEIKDSLGFHTNYIDPILTPLTESTLIGSAWQWPKNGELYNGPFFNYFLNFNTREKKELTTRGKIIAKSDDGIKVVFLESECVKNPDSLKISHNCNNQNLSLRLINLADNFSGYAIEYYNDTKLVDFDKVVFSSEGDNLTFTAKLEKISCEQIFIVNVATGEIIKKSI